MPPFTKLGLRATGGYIERLSAKDTVEDSIPPKGKGRGTLTVLPASPVDVCCNKKLGALNNRDLRKLAKDTWEQYGGCVGKTHGAPSLPTSSEHELMKTGVRHFFTDGVIVHVEAGMSRKVIEKAFFAARARAIRNAKKK